MKLRDLLANEKFNYLEVMNDNADLDREIATVESTETPDVYSYIGDNALIITTAMYYADKQEELVFLLENLVEKNCCGLAIKLDRFLKVLDQKVLDKADELKFPILLIQPHKNLGEVYQDALNHIWENTNDDLVFALNSQKVFSNLLLKNQSLRGILMTLSNILKVETALIDPFGNIEYSSSSFSRNFDKNAIRKIVSKIPGDVKLYNDTLSSISKKSYNVVIYTIRLTAHYPYYLLLLNVEKLRYPVSNFIIDHALFSIAVDTTRDLNIDYHKLEKEEMQFKNLIKLCSGEDEKRILEYVQSNSMEYFPSGRTAILYFTDFSQLFPDHLQIIGYILIYNWLSKKFDKLYNYNLYPLRNEKMYIIQTGEKNITEVVETLNKYVEILKEILDIQLNIAIGPEFHSWNFQYQSFKEALKTVQFGEKYGDYPHIKTSRPQGFRALFSNLNTYEKNFFVQSILGNLYDTDNKSYVIYMETLKKWLMNRADVSKTAREMFIHRNTVIYRLDRCKEILNSDLSDPEELFNLEIALNLIDL